jgi:hypothetical protein
MGNEVSVLAVRVVEMSSIFVKYISCVRLQ